MFATLTVNLFYKHNVLISSNTYFRKEVEHDCFLRLQQRQFIGSICQSGAESAQIKL